MKLKWRSEYGRLSQHGSRQVLTSLGFKYIENFVNKDCLEQWKATDSLQHTQPLDAALMSALFCKIPFQIDLNMTDYIRLHNLIFNEAGYGSTSLKERESQRLKALGVPDAFLVYGDVLDHEPQYRWSETKASSAAITKVNSYFSDVWPTLVEDAPECAVQLRDYWWLITSLSNDQATALVLYARCLCEAFAKPGVLAIQLMTQPHNTKVYTTVMKGLGLNGTKFGALLCEGNTLLGRGVGSVDLMEEGSYRTSESLARDKTVQVPVSTLRAAIMSVLREELKGRPKFDDIDDFWHKRWGWCVNGAYSRRYEEEYPEWKVPDIGIQRIHRRVAVEGITRNPLIHWSGTSIFTGSVKEEHGKSRAIFAGDTVTYSCFQHILGPVERVWAGKRVILDPGKGGTCGMVRRVVRAGGHGGVNVMLDYDDFNSQHTSESMKTVFECLCEVTGYDPVLGKRLISSFDRSRVFVGDKDLGYSRGTLMSGHRATTFINSVLNAAYLRVYIPDYDNLFSMHVGDDVFIKAPTLERAAEIVTAVGESPLRVNPSKQSVGFNTAEFLRVATNGSVSRGYLARSVSSAVSGSWTGDDPLDSMELIMTMRSAAWTLANRSGVSLAYRMLAPALSRKCGLKRKDSETLLNPSVSVNESPVLGRHDLIEQVLVTAIPTIVAEDVRQYPAEATHAYLSNCASEIERFALTTTGLSVEVSMLESSYKKTTSSAADDCRMSTVLIRQRLYKAPRGAASLDTLLAQRPVKGVLTQYPLLQLLKNTLSLPLLRELVSMCGERVEDDVYKQAWGTESRCIVAETAIPASDAAHLGGLTDCDIIYWSRPVYV
jgi:hypothetical protein